VGYTPLYSPTVWGRLGTSDLSLLTVDRLNYWVDNYPEYSKWEVLQLLGLHLYHILFGDPKIQEAFRATFDGFTKQYNDKRHLDNQDPDLRLRLKLVFTPEAKDLARLPWEFTYVPIPDIKRGFFLTGERKDVILTRFVPESTVVDSLSIREGPLRILTVFSQPDGENTLDEKEVNELITALDELMATGRVEVTSKKNLTYEQLLRILAEDETRPHILHFIGHGKEGQIALVEEEEKEIKEPDDPDYKSVARKLLVHWTDERELKALFKNPPRLIFLSACKGAASTSLESFKSTASELVYNNVPAVVAMQYDISNPDARVFAKNFYQQIGEGKGIDEAVKIGRLLLGLLKPPWGHRRFGTPVVYLQTDSPIVLPVQTPPTGSEQVQCRYYHECKRMIYPDATVCACPRNRPIGGPVAALSALGSDPAATPARRDTGPSRPAEDG
jgi:hypothetical protein